MFTFCTGKWVSIFVLSIPIMPAFLFSQKPFLSLSALVDTADRYLPQLAEKKALLNSASSDVTDTKNQFLPSFRLNEQVDIGTDNSIAGSYFPFGVIPSTSAGIRSANDFQASSGNVAALYGEYDLLDFGYKNARISQAKTERAFQQADLQREIYLVNGRLCRAYFNLLISERRMEVEKQTVQRYDTIFNTIRALTRSGLKPGSDSSLAKAELSKSRITYNQINERTRNYREELSFLTGIASAAINLNTGLLSAGVRQQLLMPRYNSINPLIDYYDNRRKTFVANERLISKSYLPKIMLTGVSWARGSAINYDDEHKSLTSGMGFQRFNYMAGLSFEYDLFNALHKKDRLRSFGFQREAAEQALRQEVLGLAFAGRQAQNSIDITEKNLLELPIQYQAAADTYSQKMAQYKAGIISLIDLTNAAFVLDRSQNDYVETIGNWYLAQLGKSIAAGTLSAFIQSVQ